MKLKYKEVIFDDAVQYNITKDTEVIWSQICPHCVQKHNIAKKLLDKDGQGVCGVEGCENESDFYIDFPQDEIEIIE